MSFLSLAYFGFFPVAAAGYFLLPARGKNIWLLGCSWFFYLCAGAEYVPFLILTTLLTYLVGLRLAGRGGRGTLTAALAVFVAALGVFKYLGFGMSLVKDALALVGLDWSARVPKLLLPAGISFYFFTAMGYLIDVYRGRQEAERSFTRCALLLAFFPALLSGPIGRGRDLLPQFAQSHPFDYVALREGFVRFLWGACKKLLLADRLAVMVNTVFAGPEKFGAAQVVLAACAFSIQIYCDFSAYTDMALGSARAMGFTLAENFRTPYFARSIADFWRRWHMSLSTWFRDYLYIPLGGSRKGRGRTYLNLLIVFAVSGLWHGAAASFVVWGLLNGLYQVAGAVTKPGRTKVRRVLRLSEDTKLSALWQMGCVFVLSTVAWVFFQAGSVGGALAVFRNMVKPVLWDVGGLAAMGLDRKEAAVAGVALLALLGVDVWSLSERPCERVATLPRAARWAVCLMLLLAAAVFGSYGTGYDAQSFIYFRF